MEPFDLDKEASPAIHWHEGETIQTVSAREPVKALQRVLEEQVDWIVIQAESPTEDYVFVFVEDEVRALWEALWKADWFKGPSSVVSQALRDVLKLDPEMSSTPVLRPRPDRAVPIGRGVAAGRVVLLDEEGQPVSVGTFEGVLRPKAAEVRELIRYEFRFEEGEEADVEYAEMEDADLPAADLDLGPPLSVEAPPPREEEAAPPDAPEDMAEGAEEASPPSEEHRAARRPAPRRAASPRTRQRRRTPRDDAQKVPVTISGNAPDEAEVGDILTVRFRVEWKGAGAQPLETRVDAEITPDKDLRVMLVTKGDALQPTGERVKDVPPPTKDAPTEGEFQVVVTSGGVQPAELSLMFFQGGSHLASLPFSVRIVTAEPQSEAVERRAEAAPRFRGDDEVLIWTIVADRDDEGLRRYEHHLVGVDLGQFRDFSNPIQDSGKGYEAMRTAYLKRTYERVLEPLRTPADAEKLQVRVRASGTSLCRMLIDPEVTRKLWDWRDRIHTIRVHSYDPLIPWEMVRLQHPDTREVDDRYLAEYGLVRWLPDLPPAPATLRLDRWRFLAATYPHGSAPSVQGEVEYFERDLPAHGIQPEQVDPTLKGILGTLETDGFDVLHLACHGESNLERVESAQLLIGDRRGEDGSVELEVVEASDVVASVSFSEKPGPIVFLTACEGGQAAPSLTDWEGWPHAFLKGGASVFVGTSWSVRAKPAYAFSRAFYDALLEGKALAAAATAGRHAAKQLGDASWLAYKVYGHPLAQRA